MAAETAAVVPESGTTFGNERRPRILIAASSAISRGGLEAVVHQDPFLVRVGTSSLKTLRQESATLLPDVVLLLLEGTETETLAELTGLPTRPALVVLTESLGPWANSFLRTGALGLLPRNADPPQIRAAIHAVAQGLSALHPLFSSSVVSPAMTGPRPSASLQPLTPREVEVLRMLAEGLGNKIIADRLKISEHTVKFHLSSIFGKLNAGSRTEAVTMGARLGYIVI